MTNKKTRLAALSAAVVGSVLVAGPALAVGVYVRYLTGQGFSTNLATAGSIASNNLTTTCRNVYKGNVRGITTVGSYYNPNTKVWNVKKTGMCETPI